MNIMKRLDSIKNETNCFICKEYIDDKNKTDLIVLLCNDPLIGFKTCYKCFDKVKPKKMKIMDQKKWADYNGLSPRMKVFCGVLNSLNEAKKARDKGGSIARVDALGYTLKEAYINLDSEEKTSLGYDIDKLIKMDPI